MMKNKIINFLFLMFLLSGCSDITNPSNESLSVSSESTSTSLIIESNQSDIENSEIVTTTLKVSINYLDETYSFNIEYGKTLSFNNVFEVLNDKLDKYYPYCFQLYCDSSYNDKYQYDVVVDDITLYLKKVDLDLQYDNFKIFYEQLEYFYDLKYSFEEYYNQYIMPLDLTHFKSISEHFYYLDLHNQVNLKLEINFNSSNNLSLDIPFDNCVLITIDPYEGGDYLIVYSYPCNINDDFIIPYGFQLFDFTDLKVIDDGVIENVNTSKYYYLYNNGVYGSIALSYLVDNQHKHIFSLNDNYYNKNDFNGYDLQHEHNNYYKINTATGCYYFKRIDTNKYYMYKVESYYALLSNKTYEEIKEIMELLSSDKEVYKFNGFTIYLKENKTFTIEYS